MKDNNTYTGDRDDLDLVTLEKINREKKRKRLKEENKPRKKKPGKRKKNSENHCEEAIDNINILINQCTGRGGGGQRIGTYSTHCDRK